MRYSQFGNSGLIVSKQAFGAMTFVRLRDRTGELQVVCDKERQIDWVAHVLNDKADMPADDELGDIEAGGHVAAPVVPIQEAMAVPTRSISRFTTGVPARLPRTRLLSTRTLPLPGERSRASTACSAGWPPMKMPPPERAAAWAKDSLKRIALSSMTPP